MTNARPRQRLDNNYKKSTKMVRVWLAENDGWTQRRLAKACGVQEAYISKWLSGTKAPSIEIVKKVRKITRLDIHIRCPRCDRLV